MAADRDLPTFILMGAMKCGTSSLYHYINAHPDVFMTSPKEPHYFVAEYTEGVTWRRGTWQNGEAWYRSLFAEGTSSPARGEASTTYTKWPEYPGVAERIAARLPDVKLLYLVRDPIERMRSHYQHEFIRHAERRPIDQAFAEDPQYLNASRYSTQIAQYLEYFDPSRLMVLTDRPAPRPPGSHPLAGVPLHRGRRQRRSGEHRHGGLRSRPSAGSTGWRSPSARSTVCGRRVPSRSCPDRCGRPGKNMLTTPPVEKPRPNRETVEMLREELRGEMEGLRPFLGDDFNGWGLLDPRAARAT